MLNHPEDNYVAKPLWNIFLIHCVMNSAYTANNGEQYSSVEVYVTDVCRELASSFP